MADRAILHVDMDCFYAAVEVKDDPSLKGKPVIVGGPSKSRGVVTAASYEARKFGVHSAMPSAVAHRLCPEGIFLPGRMSRYAEISKLIFRIFHDFTPEVEGLSLDEAFLDVSGCIGLFGEPIEIARKIKIRISKELNLVASVGVAPNKFLAKLGSDLEKPDGLVTFTNDDAAERLSSLSVGRIWGVGKVTQKALAKIGITKIKDLFRVPEQKLRTVLGSSTTNMLALARGQDDRPVVADWDAKSIGAERTFSADVDDSNKLLKYLDKLCDKVAARLRKSGLRARTIQIKARTSDFSTYTRAKSLENSVCTTLEIRRIAGMLFETHLDRKGRALRLIGVSASHFDENRAVQGSLFQSNDPVKAEKLDLLIDKIQEKYGQNSLTHGSH